MSASFYIVNNSTLRVADIYEAKTAGGTPVIAQHKNPSPETLNQQWQMDIKGWDLLSGTSVVTFRALEPKYYAVPQGDSVQIGALEGRWYIETAIPGFGGQAAYRSVYGA
ncbi:hypothetical protein EIP86_009156 [Pleurotus ostreatoroseus]|nr:hypothetical protein EIP86_009156 [Pleurotus ostreatoroseus]